MWRGLRARILLRKMKAILLIFIRFRCVPRQYSPPCNNSTLSKGIDFKKHYHNLDQKDFSTSKLFSLLDT